LEGGRAEEGRGEEAVEVEEARSSPVRKKSRLDEVGEELQEKGEEEEEEEGEEEGACSCSDGGGGEEEGEGPQDDDGEEMEVVEAPTPPTISLKDHVKDSAFRFDVRRALRRAKRRAGRTAEEEEQQRAQGPSLSAQLSPEGTTDPVRGKDCEAAARALDKVVKKEHFAQMVVVGQFNLGFIIAKIGSDLFILDQHACDEKYNFETLQATTTIHEQKLIRALPLEVSAMEEVVIMDNLDTFRKNGFQFDIDEEAPPLKRLKVSRQSFMAI
jgi:DNA mismatch repair protein PMS2